MFCVPLPGAYSLGKYSLQKNDISGIFWNNLFFLRFSLLFLLQCNFVILVGSSLLKIHRKIRTQEYHDAEYTRSWHKSDFNANTAASYLTGFKKVGLGLLCFPQLHDNRKNTSIGRNELQNTYKTNTWHSVYLKSMTFLLPQGFSHVLSRHLFTSTKDQFKF